MDSSNDDRDQMTVAAAAACGNLDLLQALLEAGGDPNEAETEEMDSPLMEAVYHDHVDAVRMLLDAGADMYATTNGGESALLVAVQQSAARAASLLIQRGYQLDAKRDDTAWMLVQAASHGLVEVVRWSLTQGVSADSVDYAGCSALTRASKRDQLEVVERLLSAGADPNHKDNDTEPVLNWACDHPRNVAVVRALLAGGADVNAESATAGSALHWALRHGDPEMVNALLEAGAQVTVERLTEAVWNGHTAAVRLLLQRAREMDFAHPDIVSARDRAANRGRRELVNLLAQATHDQQLRATRKVYPPPLYSIGTHVRTVTGTAREGWIVLTEWHHKRVEYGYTIEIEGVNQPRKNVPKRYWESDLEVIKNDS